MATGKKARLAEAPKQRRAWWKAVAAVLAPLPLFPALMVNLDTAAGQSAAWTVAAIGSVIMAAVFIEASNHLRRDRFLMALFMLLIGLCCVIQNLQNALGNAAHFSGGQSDHRKGEQATAQLRQGQLKQLSGRRAEQAKVAGEEAPASITAELERIKAADSRRWQSTGECDPVKITAGPSKEFCAGVASLKAKLAAATERDALDTKIATLSAKIEEAGAPPASVDPFADNVALAASVIGVEMSAHAKEVASSLKDLIKALVLELMAAFGPSAILALLRPERSRQVEAVGSTPAATESRRKARETVLAGDTIVRNSAAPLEQNPMVSVKSLEMVSQSTSETASPDKVEAFVQAKLERRDGESIPAGEIFALWCEWCQAKGFETGTQKSFGMRLKKLIKPEKKNGRARYLNVRRRETAALRLAFSNS